MPHRLSDLVGPRIRLPLRLQQLLLAPTIHPSLGPLGLQLLGRERGPRGARLDVLCELRHARQQRFLGVLLPLHDRQLLICARGAAAVRLLSLQGPAAQARVQRLGEGLAILEGEVYDLGGWPKFDVSELLLAGPDQCQGICPLFEGLVDDAHVAQVADEGVALLAGGVALLRRVRPDEKAVKGSACHLSVGDAHVAHAEALPLLLIGSDLPPGVCDGIVVQEDHSPVLLSRKTEADADPCVVGHEVRR
mmetsp:Transcript_49000/g.140670  ORF Transcript_49000/g.140670 Transcript_49000/m.140670 type:complete len:249 (+) Transcript_49000:1531-2277(+)